MKEELFHVFSEHFKPKSSLEQEKVEYNEINIFSEYQLYNLTFAKNELSLDDHRTSVVLNLCWRLLEFNVDADTPPYVEERPKSSVRIDTTSTLGGPNRGTYEKPALQTNPLDSDQEFSMLLTHKFDVFKGLIFGLFEEKEL